MVYVTGFRCFKCGKHHLPEEIENRPIPRCSFCNSGLDAEYDYDSIRKSLLRDPFMRESPAHWKYWAFLPVRDLSHIITMSEGGTPLLENNSLTLDIGCGRMLVKYEAMNPTGSFKDRGSSLEITKAMEYGKKQVVLASTGNMGASVAAYAAFAGLDCIVFVPNIVAPAKIKQIKAYGADIRFVDGDYSHAMKEAENYVISHPDSFLTGDYPWRGEGTKTVGMEIADQLYWTVPDVVIAPVGNGTLIWGIFEAFRDMHAVGVIERKPAIFGVQVDACRPVVDAWEKGVTEIIAVEDPQTLATAIACGDPIDGLGALRAIRETGGQGVSVSDAQVIEARDFLAKNGIFVEPSGAVAYAGARMVKEELKSKTVVCMATGHGLKDMYGIE
ncbi:MAG: threonine synthase [Methanosarcinales archaeon]|nr:threonine synthase [ANME-2 cluster archaeon]MDW7776320.1 threonine synthase [Methanosarcinales archaeon]